MSNLKKIIFIVVSLFVLSIIVFTMSRLAPGDPLVSYYGERSEKMTVQEKEAARERLGLNDSIPVQYIRWVENAIKGDMGISYKYKQSVTSVVSGRMTNTLLLSGAGLVLLFVFALLVGIICAWRQDSFLDWIISKIGTFVSCVPEFWMSLIFIFVFSVVLKILPSGGAYTISYGANSSGGMDIADRLVHLILPLSVLVISHLWYFAYMVRNRLLEEISQDYVLLAMAKGLTKRQVIFRHCIRNIMPSYISLICVSIPHILGGAYIIEMVFSYPGLGMLSYESAKYADYNMLMVTCLITGFIVIVCNVIGKVISEKIDPRVAHEEVGE